MYQLKKLCRLHKLTDSCLVLYSGTKTPVPSNFIYLTELDLPNLIVIYYQKKTSFFYDYDADPWNDYSSLFTKLKKTHSHVYPLSEISQYIPSVIKKVLTLKSRLPRSVTGLNKPINRHYLDSLCHDSRLIKTSREIRFISKATEVTSQAIKELWSQFKKKNFKNCQQIVLFLKCFLGELGIQYMAYPPICTVGRANQYLHSSIYNYHIKPSQLILLDIGCRYENYCSDITRTFPENGRFTYIQKKIYNIVLAIQESVIGAIHFNSEWKKLEDKCYLKIYDALSKINIISSVRQKTSRKEKIALGRLFMKHGIGHSIGLDVHESGDINKIKPNMMITIEIGIYFSKAQLKHPRVHRSNWEKYSAVGGIRIEDIVIINKKGKAIVVSDVPKTIQDIEKFFNKS